MVVCANSRWKVESDRFVYAIKRKLHGGLNIWIIFSRIKITMFYSLAALVRKLLFYSWKIKFISSHRRAISFLSAEEQLLKTLFSLVWVGWGAQSELTFNIEIFDIFVTSPRLSIPKWLWLSRDLTFLYLVLRYWTVIFSGEKVHSFALLNQLG